MSDGDLHQHSGQVEGGRQGCFTIDNIHLKGLPKFEQKIRPGSGGAGGGGSCMGLRKSRLCYCPSTFGVGRGDSMLQGVVCSASGATTLARWFCNFVNRHIPVKFRTRRGGKGVRGGGSGSGGTAAQIRIPTTKSKYRVVGIHANKRIRLVRRWEIKFPVILLR